MGGPGHPRAALACESLEIRDVPAVTATLSGGTLDVVGTPGDDYIQVFRDGADVVVRDRGTEVGRFLAGPVTALDIQTGDGNDVVRVTNDIAVPTSITGGAGLKEFRGGAGPTTLVGGPGGNLLVGGNDGNTVVSGGGPDKIYRVSAADNVDPGPAGRVLTENAEPLPAGSLGAPQETLTTDDVSALLSRAAAASASRDAIIAVVDRNGRILGVRVEDGVSPQVTGNTDTFVFAVDGAVALARTGAFFGNNQAPLTSRTVQFISQSTITQREVDSNPDVADQT